MRALLAPEVVQSSTMDCGPASLKCLLEGFGIAASYGRLREACQTDVDGTSIDTIEDVAGQLGLAAEQVMIPVDHLLLAATDALPALVVVLDPTGATHFVVVWRRFGRFLQVMDPAEGRIWTTVESFLRRVYVHQMEIPAAAFDEYARGDSFLGGLRERLARVAVSCEPLIAQASASTDWRALAALDACARLVSLLVEGEGIKRGAEAKAVLERLLQHALQNPDDTSLIPEPLWTARSAEPSADGEEQVLLRGSVLLRVEGRRREVAGQPLPAPLSPELVAALAEPPDRPGRRLIGMLLEDGVLSPLLVVLGLLTASAGLLLQALLFRGLLDVGRFLGPPEQRFAGVVALVTFVLGFALLELPIAAELLRLGRHLELRLRRAFQEKLPKLSDRYFKSRLLSDMAERAHALLTLRSGPQLGGALVRTCAMLVATLVALTWLDRGAFPLALVAAAASIAGPLIAQSALRERDLKVRTHLGGLTRFYFDALLGLVPIRAHAAERAMRREHEGLLVEWERSALGLQRAAVGVEVITSLLTLGATAWLVVDHGTRASDAATMLLFVYWALSIPALGAELAVLGRQYPAYRNVALRTFEPLGAPEEPKFGPSTEPEPCEGGVLIEFRDVTVKAGGHVLLEDVSVRIEPGTHVAIVGESGAGKSTFVACLLGWHRPSSGILFVDSEPLSTEQLEQLRTKTAWVDAGVQLWNRTLAENLAYGNRTTAAGIGRAIELAELTRVVRALPEGLQTSLGEGGALVSGGEGQRVRLGRALLRNDARLVVLDEALRGLDRESRRRLLAQSRKLWANATLLCVTHDVAETTSFDRVLVIEDGRLVEDGHPSELLARQGSRYQKLALADDAVRFGTWAQVPWRKFRLEEGRLQEERG